MEDEYNKQKEQRRSLAQFIQDSRKESYSVDERLIENTHNDQITEQNSDDSFQKMFDVAPPRISSTPIVKTIDVESPRISNTPIVKTIDVAPPRISNTPIVKTIDVAPPRISNTPIVKTIDVASPRISNTPIVKTIDVAPPRISNTPIVKTIDKGQDQDYFINSHPTESTEDINIKKSFKTSMRTEIDQSDPSYPEQITEIAQTEFDFKETVPVPLEVSMKKCKNTKTGRTPEQCTSNCEECKEYAKTNFEVPAPYRKSEDIETESQLLKQNMEEEKVNKEKNLIDFETQVQPKLNNDYEKQSQNKSDYEKQSQNRSSENQSNVIYCKNKTNAGVQIYCPKFTSKAVSCNFCKTSDVSTQKFETERIIKSDTTPRRGSTESRRGSKEIKDTVTQPSKHCFLDCPNKSKVSFNKGTLDDSLNIRIPPNTTLDNLSWSIGKKKYDFVANDDNGNEYSKTRHEYDSKYSTANSSRQSLSNEEFEAIGKMYACKLKGLETNQRILAEKLISDIFCEAQFNSLTKDTKICYSATPASSTNNSGVLPIKNKSKSKWEENQDEQRQLNFDREVCYSSTPVSSTNNSDVLPVKNKNMSKWEDQEEQRQFNFEREICYNSTPVSSTNNSGALPVKNKNISKWEDQEQQRQFNFERENFIRQSASQNSETKRCHRCNKYKRNA